MTTSPPTQGTYCYFVGNANGRGLIRIEADHSSPDAGKHIASLPRGKDSEAMAAFMVDAMNEHAPLYAALENLLGAFGRIATQEQRDTESEALADARAIIKARVT